MKRIGSEFDYFIFDDRTMDINVRQGNLIIDGTPLLCGFFDQDWQLADKYQWQEDQEIRNKIAPRQFPRMKLSEANNSYLYLSDVQPDSINQWTGNPEMDWNFWDCPFQINRK